MSDNGSGYVSRAFRDYLHLVGIRHTLATPFHSQTNGKLERHHQTIKPNVNQVTYEVPSVLKEAIAAFVCYHLTTLMSLLPPGSGLWPICRQRSIPSDRSCRTDSHPWRR